MYTIKIVYSLGYRDRFKGGICTLEKITVNCVPLRVGTANA